MYHYLGKGAPNEKEEKLMKSMLGVNILLGHLKIYSTAD
jgi:hypothetical protein